MPARRPRLASGAMLAQVTTFAIDGIEPRRVTVEVDVSAGLPAFSIVGLGDRAVREARERVRGAIANSGFEFPQRASPSTSRRRTCASSAPASTSRSHAASSPRAGRCRPRRFSASRSSASSGWTGRCARATGRWRVLLDHVAEVPEAEHEALEAVRRVAAHDVPQNRAVADRDHRLRPELGLLLETRSEPSAENEDRRGGGVGRH